MIEHDAFPTEPWCVRETTLDLDFLAQSESLFALSNGHIGLRGNLDEGEPHGLPGSYLNSVYEDLPLSYPEGGYGYPEAGQSVINVTNGKLIRLLVDDEPFDVRYGELRSHTRELDLRAGVLRREASWTSPTGRTVQVRSTRLVSFTQRAIAAICYEITPTDEQARVVVTSELVTNEPLPSADGDPRAASALAAPLEAVSHWAAHRSAALVHRTRRSGLVVATAMDHAATAPHPVRTSCDAEPYAARVTHTATLRAGETLQLVKYLAYGWSGQRSAPAVRDQVLAALTGARDTGWAGLLAEQQAYLAEFWERADVEVDGDPEIQQAVRFALFHILQAGARGERRPLPAKGLTGPGYDGHAFWDTEAYVLPVLTFTTPHAVADALRWRQNTLEGARRRAVQLGLAGAAFPWRTINGDECSGYWPAGTAAFHIGADVAAAVIGYVGATGDEQFARDVGCELLVETARLYRSLGHFDDAGRFGIDGVTGPDEYSAIADNNVYTNLMAQANLRAAADAVARYPERAGELGVGADEAEGWRDAADKIVIPYDARLGVHPQAERFTEHAVWDFDHTGPESYPLLLHVPYFDLYRRQVVKQADLVLAMYTRPDAFTPEEKARNFAYYEAITVRDSSLSACTQAVLAAEIGHLELAYDYLGEAALMDLHDLEHNTRDGVHIASLAGAWTALVAGFAGMRCVNGRLSFAPRLPGSLDRLVVNLTFRGRRLRVEVSPPEVTYRLISGPTLELTHHGELLTLHPETSVSRGIPAVHPPPAPRQPAGRAPVHRSRVAPSAPTGGPAASGAGGTAPPAG